MQFLLDETFIANVGLLLRD